MILNYCQPPYVGYGIEIAEEEQWIKIKKKTCLNNRHHKIVFTINDKILEKYSIEKGIK